MNWKPGMYAGCVKDKNGKVKGWRNYSSDQLGDLSILSLKQDAKLLQKHILKKGSEFLKDVVAKHNFNVEEVDYFLPHLSSMFLRSLQLRT